MTDPAHRECIVWNEVLGRFEHDDARCTGAPAPALATVKAPVKRSLIARLFRGPR